ncbi:hypothetical protein AVEN_190446-1, partial [Araneus ventricosus]
LVEAPGTINTTEQFCHGSNRGPENNAEVEVETHAKLLDDTSLPSVRVPPVPPVLILTPNGETSVFSVDDYQDANSWLKDFQRIAIINHWDDQMCLANIFYLCWNSSTVNWTTMRTLLTILLRSEFPRNAFCAELTIDACAERLLITRTSSTRETFEYIFKTYFCSES